MNRPSVVVLDYGSGNVHSAVRALETTGARVHLSSERRQAVEADGLVVPGVGAFGAVAERLRTVRADEIIDRRLVAGRPVLGICVGMQVLFEQGLEGGTVRDGLGQWPGSVERLDARVLPHVGWNTVQPDTGSRLFAGVESERFYFVHSYAAASLPLDDSGPLIPPVRTWSTYGSRFLAAVENGPLSATQFHPEKSGAAGLTLLSNWVGTLGTQ